MGEEKTRLEADIVDAGRGERDRGIAQQCVVGRCRTGGQAASSARRAAWSSAISASTISSRPALDHLGQVVEVRLMRWSVTRFWGKL